MVYGLRRTGKTVAMQQAICGMMPEERERTAFLTVSRGDSFRDISGELVRLEETGIRNIFMEIP